MEAKDVKGNLSAAWSSYRKALIAERGKRCESCSSKADLTVHHKDGCGLNNGSDNLQILCSKCHKLVNGNGISIDITVAVATDATKGILIQLWQHKIDENQWADLKLIVDGLIQVEKEGTDG